MNITLAYPPHTLGNLTPEQRVCVLGVGESGMAIAKWVKLQGVAVDVYDTRALDKISDRLKAHIHELESFEVSVHMGSSFEHIDMAGFALLAMSPGISPLDPSVAELLARAKINNVPIWGELEFFSKAILALKETKGYAPKVIAITGTNGKTTTTALTGTIASKAGKTVAVAGNIRPSLLDTLRSCLEKDLLPEIWVLELSSYQLYYSDSFDPDVSTVLNITEDHLDWHGEMAHYQAAKKKIFGPHTIAVVNRDDKSVMAMIEEHDPRRVISFGVDTPLMADSFGIVGDIHGGIDWLAWAEPSEHVGSKQKRRTNTPAPSEELLQVKRLIPTQALLIKGRHNATNALAALALCQAIELNMAALLHGLRDYQGEPHRVQSVAVINDVEYIDDSKGTNVGATIAALKGLGFGQVQPNIILIAGGDGKGQDFEPLQDAVISYVKAIYLIGKDAKRIELALQHSGVPMTHVLTLEEAVFQSAKAAKLGDQVLLSPACASLDMFTDYIHRAQVFTQAVQELAFVSQTTGVEI